MEIWGISSSLPNIPVTDPANNEVISELACTSEAELTVAMASAKAAFRRMGRGDCFKKSQNDDGLSAMT